MTLCRIDREGYSYVCSMGGRLTAVLFGWYLNCPSPFGDFFIYSTGLNLLTHP